MRIPVNASCSYVAPDHEMHLPIICPLVNQTMQFGNVWLTRVGDGKNMFDSHTTLKRLKFINAVPSRIINTFFVIIYNYKTRPLSTIY